MADIFDRITEPELQGDIFDQVAEIDEFDLPTGGGLQEFGKGLVDSFLMGAKGLMGTLAAGAAVEPERARVTFRGFAPPTYMQLAPEEAARPFKRAAKKIEAAREPFEMTHRGVSAKAGRILGNAVGYMGQALAGGYTAGPMGAAMVGFSIEGQQAYDSAIERGATEEQAQTERLVVGSINAAIEALQIGKVMKFAETGKHSVKAFINSIRTKSYRKMAQLGKDFGADILRHSIEEGLEEFAQEGVSMAVPAALRGDYPMKPDGSPDWLAIGEQLGASAVGGAFAGGVLGTGAGIVKADVLAPSRKRIEKTAQKIRESDISDNAKVRMIGELEKFLPEEGKLEIPESTRRVLATADKLAVPLKEMQAKRPKLKEYIKTGRGKMFGKQAKVLAETQADDPISTKQMAQGVAKGELRQDYPDVAEQFSREDWQTLVQSINEATDISQGDKDALWECLDDLFIKQKPPSTKRLRRFDKFFGTDIVASAKQMSQSKLRYIADVMNVPKAILASFDVSMPLRQAWHYTMAHPIKSIPHWGKMLKAFCSGKYSDFVALEMQTHPRYQMFVDAGLEQTKPGSRTEGEEYFQGELAHRIPMIGKVVKASEQAAVTYMNSIRLQAANHFYELMGSPDIDTKAFQDMIDFVNHSTSRGGFKGRAGKWFKKWSPELGAVLWTPKMIIGKTQAIADLRKPEIRKLVACETVRAFGGAMLTSALLALGFGGKWKWKDFLSSDFGKVVIGKTRIDMFGTYLPMFRVIAQFAIGERKAATTGRISDVERKEVITRFLRSKLNPVAGVAWDIWTEKTFLGKKMKPEGDFLTEYIAEHITPLFLQDLKDAVKYQGIGTAFLVAPLAVHGAGAATYEPTPRGDEVELKNHYAHQTYGTGWDELGPTAQDILRTFRPDIAKAEEKTRQTREDYTFIGKLAQEEQDAGRRIQKKLPQFVQKEMERLGIDVGGLRRQLKSDWYLNRKRYKQYQKDVEKMLTKSLARPISNPSWNVMNDDVQAVMLQTIVDQCKKLIRQKIVMQATMKDLERRG